MRAGGGGVVLFSERQRHNQHSSTVNSAGGLPLLPMSQNCCSPCTCLRYIAVQIFSDSPESVDITGCTFQSNVALMSGGAVYAGGSETLTITASTFNQNEVGTGDLGTGAGGDVWTNRLVELTVVDSTFSGSTAEYGGAAIVCCGATITTSNFSSTDVASTDVSLVSLSELYVFQAPHVFEEQNQLSLCSL